MMVIQPSSPARTWHYLSYARHAVLSDGSACKKRHWSSIVEGDLEELSTGYSGTRRRLPPSSVTC